MSTGLDELRRKLLLLPPEERAELAVSLLDSLDPGAGDEEQFWIEEATRRSAEIAAGIATVRAADDLLAELRNRLSPRPQDRDGPEP